MALCPALPSGAGFITSVTASVDCQARILGSGAWAAFASPGSALSATITGLLTIFVALIGYNLLLGGAMTVRGGTVALVKIGVVLTLATSWAAYRTLVYDVVTDAPAQLIATIGPDTRVKGSDGTLVQRLDAADETMAQLAVLGAGNRTNDGAQIPPPPFGGFDAFALGASRIVFELTAVAGLAVFRICAGLMLAVGPFFIAFLLFDATRSLFEGWVRVLFGVAFAGFGVMIVLGLELALVQPWLLRAVALRKAGEDLPMIPAELFVLSSLFTLITLLACWACVRVVSAFRLPFAAPVAPVRSSVVRSAVTVLPSQWLPPHSQPGGAEPSRAAAVAAALVNSVRRDAASFAVTEQHRTSRAAGGPFLTSAGNHAGPATVSTGRAFRRSTIARSSASAAARDSTL